MRFTEGETSWWARPRRRLGLRGETHCAFRSRERVVSLGVGECWERMGDVSDLGVLVEVVSMGVKEGTREAKSLVTVTGTFRRLEDAMKVLEGRVPMRKF